MRLINGLDLFSGIGGLSKALESYVKPIAYCENDTYAQSVLLSRQHEFAIGKAPIWDNIETLESKFFKGCEIDIIYGGFPCQDISTAGNGVGLGGKRSGLYWELFRLVEEISPTWVFLENVPAIRTKGLLTVVRSLTDIGYDCRWTCISAAEVGAPHLRKRWFLLANSNRERLEIGEEQSSRKKQPTIKRSCFSDSEILANSKELGRNDRKAQESELKTSNAMQARVFSGGQTEKEWWISEPAVDRVVNGLPNRVDRIKGLGNAVVPLQAKTAFERLIGFKFGLGVKQQIVRKKS